MFIELLTAIGIGTAALPSDASEPTPIIDYPDPTEVMCLAENMYHEAKNQGTAGWSAVASVTFNRIRDNRFPNTVCEVVKQGPTRESWKTRLLDIPDEERKYYPIRHRCQFSWYCDGKSDEIPSFDGDIGSSRTMIVPATFDIEYRWVGSSNHNPYLNKISTCVLENMSVKYGGSVGYQAFEPDEAGDTPPVETEISLQFKELEIITKTRAKEGY